jgi:hypothetical protein
MMLLHKCTLSSAQSCCKVVDASMEACHLDRVPEKLVLKGPDRLLAIRKTEESLKERGVVGSPFQQ